MDSIKKETTPIPKSEERYRALLELNLDPLIIINKKGEITEVNEAAVLITAASRVTLMGSRLADYFRDPARVDEIIKDLWKKESVENITLELNKEQLASEVLLKGMVTQHSENSEAVIILHDFTWHKQTEEQTAHLAAIVTSSNDAIISKNLEGVITVWNKSAEKIFGYTAQEAIGKNVSMIIPANKIEEENKIIERINNGEYIEQYETQRKRKDGKIISVAVSTSPIKDSAGNIKAISKIAREITQQKRFEQELIEARRNAERDKRLAEEAVEAKQQFLSNMSHEIRTPLNAIIGFTKVVLKSNLDEKQKEYLNAIKVSGDALIVLINDILDLAKVEAGKMTFEQIPFKLFDSISSMLHLFETKLFKKNVELVKKYDNQIPEVLVGDPVRLHQVILNLVSNAIKFTSSGKITVSVKLREEDSEKATIEFSVTDTGIGIPEDKLDTIFNNFQQATSGTARVYGGTGLGLAIVKQLVLSQGGSLQVKSKVNEGSTFSFTLTFTKTREKIEAKKEEAVVVEDGADNVKILVAEDVVLNQLLIKTLLKEFGFDGVVAPNGKIAVEILEKQNFDVVLMDLQMPEMNGYEATAYIRNTIKSDIPIIALTADVTTADVEKCRAVGMNDYLSKPIDDKLLYNKILKYIDKPIPSKKTQARPKNNEEAGQKTTNLEYLKQHTRGNPEMMKQMIKIYLDETPRLIDTMKQSIDNMDWDSLKKAAHSMIPTFSIVGINNEYEEMAKKIKEHAAKKEDSSLINTLLVKIEDACSQAVKELEAELETL
ncbi:MAG: PAS domain S-box protein [Bacteroidetes bacterium]|nr:PAS domain S-box protein [Bacteroidota bacterium]